MFETAAKSSYSRQGARRIWQALALGLLLGLCACGEQPETASPPAGTPQSQAQSSEAKAPAGPNAGNGSLLANGSDLARLVTLVFSGSLLLLTFLFAIAAVMSVMISREWPEIETHWGGLGGGMGGIRMSPSLLFLLAAFVFGAILASNISRTVETLESLAADDSPGTVESQSSARAAAGKIEPAGKDETDNADNGATENATEHPEASAPEAAAGQ